MPIVGQITLPVRVGECRHDVTFVVVKQGAPVLGKDACVQLGLVSRTGCMNVKIAYGRRIPRIQTQIRSVSRTELRG